MIRSKDFHGTDHQNLSSNSILLVKLIAFFGIVAGFIFLLGCYSTGQLDPSVSKYLVLMTIMAQAILALPLFYLANVKIQQDNIIIQPTLSPKNVADLKIRRTDKMELKKVSLGSYALIKISEAQKSGTVKQIYTYGKKKNFDGLMNIKYLRFGSKQEKIW